MRGFKAIVLLGLAAAVLATAMPAGVGHAAVHQWAELDWTLRGSATTATNDNGNITITTTGGSSGDPSPDNWVLTAPLPKLDGAKPMWMQFSFIDSQGSTGYGPRAYASAAHDNGETLIQGGALYGYSSYWVNYSRYEDGKWLPTSWHPLASRGAGGEHTFKVGLFGDGSVGMWFDGALVDRIVAGGAYPNLPVDGFTRAYLGMTGPVDTDFSVTYTGFTYGYSAIPEPTSIAIWSLIAVGFMAFGCSGRGRRRANTA